jgi:hypothetical protein
MQITMFRNSIVLFLLIACSCNYNVKDSVEGFDKEYGSVISGLRDSLLNNLPADTNVTVSFGRSYFFPDESSPKHLAISECYCGTRRKGWNDTYTNESPAETYI